MAFYPLEEHEYRYRPSGGEFTAWTACTVKPIPVGNIDVAAGDFQVRVRAFGNRPAGGILSSLTAFTISAANVAPVASAGADNTITLPTNSVTLTGSGTDSDGTIASYLWEQTIGAAATITTPAAATTTVTGLAEGTYEFRLTVTDNQGATHQDTVQVVVNAVALADYKLIIDGNSISANAYYASGLPSSLQDGVTSKGLTDVVYSVDYAVGGQTTVNMSSDAATQIDPAYDPAKKKTVLVAWEGYNHIRSSESVTAQIAFDAIKSYFQARRSANPEIVLIVPTITQDKSRVEGFPASPTFEERRLAYNQLIRDAKAAGETWIDAVADVGADTILDPDDTNISPDGIHFTDFAYQNYVIPRIKGAIMQALYGDAQPAPFLMGADTTAPTLANYQIYAPGQIKLTYSESLVGTPAVGNYTLASGRTITSLSVSGTVVTLVPSSAYDSVTTDTLSYTGTALKDAAGNSAPTFSNLALPNNITANGSWTSFDFVTTNNLVETNNVWSSSAPGTGYGGLGATAYELRTSENGGIRCQYSASDAVSSVLGFKLAPNGLTGAANIDYGFYFNNVSGTIKVFADTKGATAVDTGYAPSIGDFIHLERINGDTFVLYASADGVNKTLIYTFAATNSAYVYPVVDVYAAGKVYYPEMMGLSPETNENYAPNAVSLVFPGQADVTIVDNVYHNTGTGGWDTYKQVASNYKLPANTEAYLGFRYKGDKEAMIGFSSSATPGGINTYLAAFWLSGTTLYRRQSGTGTASGGLPTVGDFIFVKRAVDGTFSLWVLSQGVWTKRADFSNNYTGELFLHININGNLGTMHYPQAIGGVVAI